MASSASFPTVSGEPSAKVHWVLKPDIGPGTWTDGKTWYPNPQFERAYIFKFPVVGGRLQVAMESAFDVGAGVGTLAFAPDAHRQKDRRTAVIHAVQEEIADTFVSLLPAKPYPHEINRQIFLLHRGIQDMIVYMYDHGTANIAKPERHGAEKATKGGYAIWQIYEMFFTLP